MANYQKKRRYSGCWMCKAHKRFPGTFKMETRKSEFIARVNLKEAKQDIDRR